MFECKPGVSVRSLNTIGGWTSPVELLGRGHCDLLFVRGGWLEALWRGGFDGELDWAAPNGGGRGDRASSWRRLG